MNFNFIFFKLTKGKNSTAMKVNMDDHKFDNLIIFVFKKI